MGVPNDEVYPQVKELLEIPEDEPIFIVRAQDGLSRAILKRYMEVSEITSRDDDFLDELYELSETFYTWQQNNADKVKLPD